MFAEDTAAMAPQSPARLSSSAANDCLRCSFMRVLFVQSAVCWYIIQCRTFIFRDTVVQEGVQACGGPRDPVKTPGETDSDSAIAIKYGPSRSRRRDANVNSNHRV